MRRKILWRDPLPVVIFCQEGRIVKWGINGTFWSDNEDKLIESQHGFEDASIFSNFCSCSTAFCWCAKWHPLLWVLFYFSNIFCRVQNLRDVYFSSSQWRSNSKNMGAVQIVIFKQTGQLRLSVIHEKFIIT